MKRHKEERREFRQHKKMINQRKGTREISPYLCWEDDHTMARRATSWLEFLFTCEDCLASWDIVGTSYRKS
jgi:hypothetical protein